MPILQSGQTVADAPTTTANIRNPHKHPTVARGFVLRRLSYAYGVRNSSRKLNVCFGAMNYGYGQLFVQSVVNKALRPVVGLINALNLSGEPVAPMP
jgi:hypothetical protein